MLIDLPVVVLLDCQDPDRHSLAAQKIVGTIRYDTENSDVEALFFPAYPPPDDADTKYWESANGVLAHISSAANTRIKNAAARSPYDYMVGTEQERTIAQEEVNEQRAQDGQFGAGA
jgi:hypothetical protein